MSATHLVQRSSIAYTLLQPGSRTFALMRKERYMPFDMKELLLKLGALLRKLRCDRVFLLKCFVNYGVFYQRWIKKKNRRVKHSRPRNDEVPATKRVKLTPWHAYTKDFGKTDGTFANYSLQFHNC